MCCIFIYWLNLFYYANIVVYTELIVTNYDMFFFSDMHMLEKP